MAPKTKEQFAEIRKNTKTSIKEVALELFAKNGYHSTSISQITKAAGISKGLVYSYFESKEALLHEIILEAVDEGEVLMNTVLETSQDPHEQLVRMVELSIEWVSERLHHWKLLTSLAFQTDALQGLESILQAQQEKAIQQTVDIFQRMGFKKPMEEAMFLGATIDGIFLHYMFMGDQYPLELMKTYLLDRFKPKNHEK